MVRPVASSAAASRSISSGAGLSIVTSFPGARANTTSLTKSSSTAGAGNGVVALLRLGIVRDRRVGRDRGRQQQRDRSDRDHEDSAPDREHPLRVQRRVPGEPLGHALTLTLPLGDAQRNRTDKLVTRLMVNDVIADPLAVANELRPVLLRLARELRQGDRAARRHEPAGDLALADPRQSGAEPARARGRGAHLCSRSLRPRRPARDGQV